MSDSLLGIKSDTVVEAAASIVPENTSVQNEKIPPQEEDVILPSSSESNMSIANGGNLESESSYTDNNNYQEGGQVLESSSHRGISHRVRDDLHHLKENVTQGVTATPEMIRKGGTVTFQCFTRCFCNIPKKWPRSYTFVIGVVLPLWLLITVSLVLGLFLASLEKPQEILDNDAILADRANFLVDQASSQSIAGSVLSNSTEAEVLQNLDFFSESSGAFESLSFNWIRCWNASEVDLKWVLYPVKEQVQHARYRSQLEFYVTSWETSQRELYEENLVIFGDNPTLEQKQDAFMRASEDATGGLGCDENYAGTAWFWFTVMTTVGYGNQAPVTSGGRLLIWTCGFLSILLFATVLGFAGYIFSNIFDDAVRRVKLHWFATPWMGCLLWGTSWFVWMLYISYFVDDWWGRRLQDKQFADLEDSLWFAYISTSTVGLGDFFLQPEVLFVSDVLNFSLMYLIGFVLLSSFLGKFGELLSSLAPNLGTKLPEHLAMTNFLSCQPTDFGILYTFHKSHRKTVEKDERLFKLRKLLKQDVAVARDAQALVKEEKLISELLTQTREKLESLGKEEQLLKALLQKVKDAQPEKANLLDLQDETLKKILSYETRLDLAATARCSKRLNTLTKDVKRTDDDAPLTPVMARSILSGKTPS